jgi:hypothetical protein
MPSFLTIWRRNLCSASGAIAGAIVGLVMGLYLLQPAPLPLSHLDVLAISTILGLLAWLALLMIVGLWQHYGIANIAFSSLVNSLITALLTVFVTNKVQIAVLAVWIGILIGTIVGALLCWLCSVSPRRIPGVDHGLR